MNKGIITFGTLVTVGLVYVAYVHIKNIRLQNKALNKYLGEK